MKDAIKFTKDADPEAKVKLTLEDALDANSTFIMDVCNMADENCVDTIGLADCRGNAQPEQVRKLVWEICCMLVQKKRPQGKNWKEEMEISWQGNNKMGMAAATAIAALHGGASEFHTSLFGIGSQNGIVPFESLIAAMDGGIAYHQKETCVNIYDTITRSNIVKVMHEVGRKLHIFPFNNPIVGLTAATECPTNPRGLGQANFESGLIIVPPDFPL